MVGTIVHVHVLDQHTAHAVLGKHTLHDLDEEGVHAGLDVLVEGFLHEYLGSSHTLAAGIAGERKVFTVGHLLAGENHLVGIDNDYIVATLHVGRIAGLVLAAKNLGNLGAKMAKNLIGGIDHHPFAFHALSVGS